MSIFISGKYINAGLLFLRIGLGFLYIVHGYPKLFGGPEIWEQYGEAVRYIGIESFYVFFGFVAAMAEFFGGIFLLLGLYIKPTLIILMLTMIVATFHLAGQGEPFSIYSHPLKMAVLFFSLLFIGPGKYSLDHKLNKKIRR